MNRAETAELLAMCAAYDARTIGDTDVLAWAQALADIPATDAQTAIIDHYQRETRRAMPADVITGVRRIRRDRLEHADATFRPSDAATDNPHLYRAELAAHRRAIGDGHTPPQPALTRAVPPRQITGTFRSVPNAGAVIDGETVDPTPKKRRPITDADREWARQQLADAARVAADERAESA
jgi:hypothetical protein